MPQVIHIHVEAPSKPPVGAPCNGCGVCCLAEPCPVGVLVSRRRHGACAALVWSQQAGRYHCGVLQRATQAVGRHAARGPVGWWAAMWARAWQAWVRRLISAGSGCDATLEVDGVPPGRAS